MSDPTIPHTPVPDQKGIQNAFLKLYHIVVQLRGPDGCPWDREQTPASLRSSLVEEAYECLHAIDENDAPN
ncbi:MAG TPA: MazG family protein, partial [Spirochaetia bacterium]|nr:MazG family protein [Spirochaetia bacterium]